MKSGGRSAKVVSSSAALLSPGRGTAEEATDLRTLLTTLAENRWWIIASVVLCTAVMTTAAFLMTPVYRVTVILAPAAADRGSGILNSALGQLGGLAAIAGVNVGSGDAETEEALAVVTLPAVHRALHLGLQPDAKAVCPRLGRGDGQVEGSALATDAGKAYRLFDNRIRSVTRDKKTGLITLQVDWINRNEAAAWANELAQRVNDEMRNREVAAAGASIGFLERELQSTNVLATRDAIGRLIESQVKNRMLANVTREYVFRVVDGQCPPMPTVRSDRRSS